MKKIICLLLCLVTVFSFATCFAADDIKVIVNGKEVVFDQKPIIDNNRTLVPLRAIFEALGASVGWDNDTNSVIATKDDTVIFMQIGHNKLFKNNEAIELDVPPKLVNDRTLVPVRAIAESFNLKVSWDEATQTVTIE